MNPSVQEAALDRQPQQSRSRLHTILGALALPGATLLGVYLMFVVTPIGRTVDLAAFSGRLDAGHQLHLLNAGVLNAITVTSAGAGLVSVVVVGVWRHHVALAIRSAGAVMAAALSAQLMKLTLPHAGLQDQLWSWAGGGSFPSGHTTIAASMSLALLAVSSESWRCRLAGPLMAWTVLTATATITMGWHRPSDVLGALALAVLWHRVGNVSDLTRGRLRDTIGWSSWMTRAREWGRPAAWWSLATAIVLLGSRPLSARGETFAEIPSAPYLTALTVVAVAVAIQFVAVTHPTRLPASARAHSALAGPPACGGAITFSEPASVRVSAIAPATSRPSDSACITRAEGVARSCSL